MTAGSSMVNLAPRRARRIFDALPASDHLLLVAPFKFVGVRSPLITSLFSKSDSRTSSR
jgi:hypothetical protein